MAFLKQSVKKILMDRQNKVYGKRVCEKQVSYGDWIVKQEKKTGIDNVIVSELGRSLTNDFSDQVNGGRQKENDGFPSENAGNLCCFKAFDKKVGKASTMTFMLTCLENEAEKHSGNFQKAFRDNENDVIIFANSKGELSPIAVPLIYQKMQENKNIILIYGDEDVKEDGIRKNPWFKPDWSPDTFLSGFYFGSLVAIRSSALKEMQAERIENPGIYELCYELIREHGMDCVCHIPEILFHTKKEGYEAAKNLTLHKKAVWQNPKEEKPLVSVIIPSKDNPRVLFQCIHSLLDRTRTEYPYEIRIIDNGSSESNRKSIEGEVAGINETKQGGSFFKGLTYDYAPMPFNFSKMCNMGASQAEGELLLFLNDDIEIVDPHWLSKLADKAILSYVGAVGAKLLYPDSQMIQHAGITNLRVGPAHKLQFLSDEQEHYYGKNRGVHNVMAVTGACLLVRKEVFEKAGGFTEKLAVAFNDVDLCYTIFEMGYYNVVRNDVILYHHESLSRGKDGESEEKQQRLLKEKDILYERHQKLYGKDPFYHKYLTTDMLESEYGPAFHYQVTLDMPWSSVAKQEELPKYIREDSCVVIGMECAMDIYKWKYGVTPDKGEIKPSAEDMGYYFQGYTFIIGSNNACYKKTLLLQNKENRQVLRIAAEERYRPDIKNNLKDQCNVDLTGFAAKVQLDSIPEGVYRFGMLAEDRCSRQKLVNWSSWVLQVGENHGL